MQVSCAEANVFCLVTFYSILKICARRADQPALRNRALGMLDKGETADKAEAESAERVTASRDRQQLPLTVQSRLVSTIKYLIANASRRWLHFCSSLKFLRDQGSPMPRPRSPALTDAEARVMAVLWQRNRATVADVVAALKRNRPVSYSTVQTILRILETKAYVAHEKVGRAFIYRPRIDERQARRRALKHLVTRLFDGSLSQLVVNILEDGQIDPQELSRLKKFIEDA